MRFPPRYPQLHRTGELSRRARMLRDGLSECAVCPRECRANRTRTSSGKCRSGLLPVISQASAHFGEEAPLVGQRGSGTIFFTNCNLACLYCQNYDISQQGRGEEVTIERLAGMMLRLQEEGCHNINLVTPTHFVPQILSALDIAAGAGLEIPLVYNCGGYESLRTLEALESVVDIYMPDLKYWDDGEAQRYSGVPHYRETACRAVLAMHAQVGDLELDGEGIALRGLLIRHLVLPNSISGTEGVMEFIAQNISRNSYVNIMPQYRPCYQAWRRPEINRPITLAEFHSALEVARLKGLKRGFQSSWDS